MLNWFARTKLKIKIGDMFIGDKAKIASTVAGYVLYKEWDPEDKRYYYFEEWELTGFNDYDSWLEYDHYSRKLTLFYPIELDHDFEPKLIKKHAFHTVIFKDDKSSHSILFEESSKAEAVKRDGTLTYHVFPGDEVYFAQGSFTHNGKRKVLSLEKYNNKEKDAYIGEVLSAAEQKELFGKKITPFNWPMALVLMWVIMTVGSIIPIPVRSTQTYCGSRAVSSPAEISSYEQTTGKKCVKRSSWSTINYGGSGGGK